MMKGLNGKSGRVRRFKAEGPKQSARDESASQACSAGGYVRRLLPGFNPIEGKLMDRFIELQLLVY